MSAPSIVDPPHIHVSEREPGSWTSCAWCSAVMLARFCHDAKIPATLAEAKKLRELSGLGAVGANPDQVRAAMQKRYGWNGTKVTSFDALWAALKSGWAASISGSMGVFPYGNTMRRWDPAFAGGHNVFIVKADSQDRVWWDDPLAPTGSYQGQWVGKVYLKKFVDGLAGGSCIVGPKFVPKTLTTAQKARIAILQANIASDSAAVVTRENEIAVYKARITAYNAEIAAIKATIA